MAIPLRTTLTQDEIRVLKDCDTDDDEGEYTYIRKALFHPIPDTVSEPAETKVEAASKEEKTKPDQDETNSEAGSSEIEAEEDVDEGTEETRLLEKALFALQAHLRFVKRISKGIYLVELLSNNKTQCLKIVRRKSRYRERIPMELRMLSHIKSLPVQRHIQVMNGFVLTDGLYAFLSDYAPDLLHTKGLHKKPREVRSIMRQLLVGIRQLHRNSVIHRDVKGSNLLWDGTRLTIVDFDKATWNTPKGHHVIVGTIGLLSPEVARYERDGHKKPEPYTEKCDIYSAGVLFGCLLFHVSESECLEMHASIFREDADRYLPPLTAQLLKSMLRYNPKKRPSAHKLLQHAYFKEGAPPPPMLPNVPLD